MALQELGEQSRTCKPMRGPEEGAVWGTQGQLACRQVWGCSVCTGVPALPPLTAPPSPDMGLASRGGASLSS